MSKRQAAPLRVLIQKGACAMRATFAQCAIVVVTISAFSGCRSGASSSAPSSGWNWGFGSKNAASTSSSVNNPPSGPQLPSQTATPGNGPGLGATTRPPGSTPGDQAGGTAYSAGPYAGQSTVYNNAGTAAAGVTAGGYQPPQAPPYSPPANTIAPQNGPYSDGVNQSPPAQTYPTTPYGGAYQTPGAPGAYQGSATSAPADPAQGYPSGGANGYANAGAPAGPPADGYRGESQGTPAQTVSNPYTSSSTAGAGTANTAGTQMADTRGAGDRYAPGTTAPEQGAADHYGTANTAAGAPGAADPAGDRYQPGSTTYNPGQTGYSPPGVPAYQVPAQPNVVSTPRRDPYYRPGGTGDFSAGNSQAPPATDRYAAPVTGAGTPDAYAPPGGSYQSPAPPAGQ
jgi:hypothetical protein